MNTILKSSIRLLALSLTSFLFAGCATQDASTSSVEKIQKEGIRDEPKATGNKTGNETAGNPSMSSLDLNTLSESPHGSSSSSRKSQAPASSPKKVVSEEQMLATLRGYRVGVTKLKQFQSDPVTASEKFRMHDMKMQMSTADGLWKTSLHITVISSGREVCDLEFEGADKRGTKANMDEFLLKTITFAP